MLQILIQANDSIRLYTTLSASSTVINHPVYTTTSYYYYLEDVTCRGTEKKLSECRHGSASVLLINIKCIKDVNDAGVMCTSKFLIFSPT